MKNSIKLSISCFLFSLIISFISCSKQEIKPNDVNTEKTIQNTNKLVLTACDITGATVVNSGSAVVIPNTSTTYSYINNTGIATNIVWSISPNPVGSATLTSNGSIVTVTYLSNFISGTLSAAGSGGTVQTCNTVLNITSNSTPCSCPDPVIICSVAVSGGHPYWRFYVSGVQTGDTVLWTSVNAQFLSLTTTAGTVGSPTIVNPLGTTGTAFTLYCEVTRRCTNGTIRKRKAYYRNEYGGSKTSGTSGYVNIVGDWCSQFNTGPTDQY